MSEKNIPRTYHVRTLGCQMNVHDSERLAGLLDAHGYVPVESVPHLSARATEAGDGGADVVVINTCSVRENAANRLFGNLGQLAQVKRERPGFQIAVAGCLAQQMREGIVKRAPYVDAVLGTHNLDVIPALLDRARHNAKAAVEIEEAIKVFPSMLPTRRESVSSAWVSISVGCNNTCTFCIVPHLRGKERDRRPGDILAEVEALAEQGVIEVTLLGQNVNSYGVGFGDRGAFAKIIRAVGRVSGIQRVRFTSPHPAAFSDDVIEAMADTETVMPALHMPLQSGSDAVLRQMRRSYRREKFMGILHRVRQAIPDAAISTDIIVGFPGETDEDFEQTLQVVREARFASAYTFIYSKRPGTPAADREDQVDPAVASERLRVLAKLQNEISLAENQAQEGKLVEVLLSEGEGDKDKHTGRVTGRARDSRLVHVALPTNLSEDEHPRPGDLVTARVTHGAPHNLVADSALSGGEFSVQRTKAGDAWQRGNQGATSDHAPVTLGIPTLRIGTQNN